MTVTAFAREKMCTYMPFMNGILSRTNSIPTLAYDPPPAYDSKPCNVVIFGETGVGKSSVVNLIAGDPVAKTSPDAGACTFASRPYHVVLESYKPFCIWDTIGLNEPEISREDYLRAIKHAYTLIKDLERSGGVHLLLLCMRGRITKSVQQMVNVLHWRCGRSSHPTNRELMEKLISECKFSRRDAIAIAKSIEAVRAQSVETCSSDDASGGSQ